RTVKVIAQLPVEVATYLMNEKREALHGIESKTKVQVVLVPNRYMETPAYEIRRIRDDEAGLPENSGVSHQIPVVPTPSVDEAAKREQRQPVAAAVVTSTIPSLPPPPSVAAEVAATAKPAEQIGVLVRLWRFFFGGAGQAAAPEKPSARPRPEMRRDRPESRHPRERDRHGRGGRDRDRGRHEAKDRPTQEPRKEHRQERKPARDHSHDHARAEHKTQPHAQPAPRAQAAPPQVTPTAHPASSERVEGSGAPEQGRGDRERSGRGRRGRRRRGGRGRGGSEDGHARQQGHGNDQAATAGEGEHRSEMRAEGRSETSGPANEARREAQHSLDLGAPRNEEPRADHGHEPSPRAESAARENAGNHEGDHAKSFTVWSSSPSPTSTSWGPSGPVRRDE
ncbi:MAG TPA: hypothetical protein VFS24_10995, partial [Steroidobacteraceae bacterium]|nr:hypothetical protein [Steroidobacteraceae bacterium]